MLQNIATHQYGNTVHYWSVLPNFVTYVSTYLSKVLINGTKYCYLPKLQCIHYLPTYQCSKILLATHVWIPSTNIVPGFFCRMKCLKGDFLQGSMLQNFCLPIVNSQSEISGHNIPNSLIKRIRSCLAKLISCFDYCNICILNHTLKNWVISGLFRLLTGNKIDNDWIRTTDRWCWKWRFHQLCHNHGPGYWTIWTLNLHSHEWICTSQVNL